MTNLSDVLSSQLDDFSDLVFSNLREAPELDCFALFHQLAERHPTGAGEILGVHARQDDVLLPSRSENSSDVGFNVGHLPHAVDDAISRSEQPSHNLDRLRLDHEAVPRVKNLELFTEWAGVEGGGVVLEIQPYLLPVEMALTHCPQCQNSTCLLQRLVNEFHGVLDGAPQDTLPALVLEFGKGEPAVLCRVHLEVCVRELPGYSRRCCNRFKCQARTVKDALKFILNGSGNVPQVRANRNVLRVDLSVQTDLNKGARFSLLPARLYSVHGWRLVSGHKVLWCHYTTPTPRSPQVCQIPTIPTFFYPTPPSLRPMRLLIAFVILLPISTAVASPLLNEAVSTAETEQDAWDTFEAQGGERCAVGSYGDSPCSSLDVDVAETYGSWVRYEADLIAVDYDLMTRFTPEGDIVWQVPSAGHGVGVHPLPALGRIIVSHPFVLEALDAATGATLWTAPTAWGPSTVVGDRIYHVGSAGYESLQYDISTFSLDGALLDTWRVAAWKYGPIHVAVAGGKLAFTTGDATVFADFATRTYTVETGLGYGVLASGTTFIFPSSGRLVDATTLAATTFSSPGYRMSVLTRDGGFYVGGLVAPTSPTGSYVPVVTSFNNDGSIAWSTEIAMPQSPTVAANEFELAVADGQLVAAVSVFWQVPATGVYLDAASLIVLDDAGQVQDVAYAYADQDDKFEIDTMLGGPQATLVGWEWESVRMISYDLPLPERNEAPDATVHCKVKTNGNDQAGCKLE